VVSLLWGKTAYYVKLNGEYLSRYSNEIEPVGLRKCPRIITVLLKLGTHYPCPRVS